MKTEKEIKDRITEIVTGIEILKEKLKLSAGGNKAIELDIVCHLHEISGLIWCLNENN